MVLSLAQILLCGFALGGAMRRLRLPALLGMMAAGILLGPHALNLIDPSLLAISPDLRQVALVVILLRAGLALDLADLKRIGRPAILMCFVPATLELMAIALLGPGLLGISRLEAAVLGAVLAAVSPAVVVPRMLWLMEAGYGTDKGIPQLIMAGASVDDVFVIILFTAFTGMQHGQGFDAASLLRVPVSIALGLLLGIAAGSAAAWALRRVHARDTVRMLMLLALALLLVALESAVQARVPVSGLLAVMALGATLRRGAPALTHRVSGKLAKVWVGAELMLFVLVGAAVDVRYIGYAGLRAVVLILAALLVRMAGVSLCMARTPLTRRERLFAAIAYLPKATVQAAIGGIPLAMGFPAGDVILAVAVLAILITAPLGAIGVDISYKRLLARSSA